MSEPTHEAVDRACGLAPRIAASADEIEQRCRRPDALVGALHKTARGYQRALRESVVTQSRAARAQAQLDSARVYLLSSLREIWRDVGRSGALGLDQGVTIRLAAAFTSNAFERRFRDIHTVAQQLHGRDDHYENAPKFLVGLEPDTTFL
jgi:hypothetical protein